MGDPKVAQCSPQTRGIWMDALCTMMGLGTYRIEGTDEQLARACRATADQIRDAHDELRNHNVAEVHIAANGHKTWVCRRLLRDREINEIRRKASLTRWRGRAANEQPHILQPRIRDPDASVLHMQNNMQNVEYGTGTSGPGPVPFGESENLLFHPDSRAVVHFLNEASGLRHRETDANLRAISDRLSEEGVTLVGVREMIAHQVADWKGTDLEKHLNPTTLFKADKFDKYYANRNSTIIKRDRSTTVLDLKTIIGAKQSKVDALRNQYAHENATGLQWSNPDKRKEYSALKKEIGELNNQLSNMA